MADTRDNSAPRTYWSPDYALGVTVLDEDHRMICDMLAEIDAHLDAGQLDDDLLAKLRDLRAHLKSHYATEDALMANFDDDLARAHRDRHQRVHGNSLELVDLMRGCVEDGSTTHEIRGAVQRFTSLFFEEMIRFDFDLVGLLQAGSERYSPSV